MVIRPSSRSRSATARSNPVRNGAAAPFLSQPPKADRPSDVQRDVARGKGVVAKRLGEDVDGAPVGVPAQQQVLDVRFCSPHPCSREKSARDEPEGIPVTPHVTGLVVDTASE